MSRDTNFYYSFLVLTPARRRAIVAVWDFCRAVDDAVDDAPAETEEERALAFEALAGWRREVEACFTGVAPKTPQGRALQPYCRSFKLPRRPFEDLIDGVSLDVGFRRFRTFNELYQYCYKVASTVGLICVEIFGCREVASRDYAVDLGVALQLTNILRDVPTDLARNRLYLPLDDLARFACTEDNLRTTPRAEPVTALLRHQAVRARRYYERAANQLPVDDARRLAAAEIMGAIYFALLEEIERRDFDVFSDVVRLPRPQRAAIALKTWFRIMTGSRPRPPMPMSDDRDRHRGPTTTA
jgi:phytoene synthase